MRARSGSRGATLALRSNQDAIRAGIAYVSEDRLNLGLNMRQSVGDNLVLASLDRLANALGLDPAGPAPGAGRRLGRAAAHQGPGPRPTRCSSSRAATSSASCWPSGWPPSPKVLILDSPTVGVDIGNKRGIYELIAELAASGVGILLISDEVREVFTNCDRVLHMRDGRIVGETVPGAIAEHALEEQVYA